MPTRMKYYWKNNKGKVCSSWGIELTEEEKNKLAKTNNKLLKEYRIERAVEEASLTEQPKKVS